MAKTIEAMTKAEMAFREIRKMITEGQLKPGQPIVHRVLSEHLSISNVPVIEALRRLEAEGLLERRPHNHARVKKWNVREHIERLLIREVLEGLAARECSRKITPEQLAELSELAQKADSSSESKEGNLPNPDMDARFHLLIVGISGMAIVEGELRRLDLYNRTMSRSCPLRRKMPTNCHQPIVAAIASRDPGRAERAAREHLRDARQSCISVARQLGLLDEHEYLELEEETGSSIQDS